MRWCYRRRYIAGVVVLLCFTADLVSSTTFISHLNTPNNQGKLVGMKNMFLWLYFLDHYLDIARI
jgi:hypothetical protein